MDFTARVLFVIVCLLIAVLVQQYLTLSKPLDAPKLDVNEYWGPGSKSSYKEDPKIINNRIFYPDEVIEDLKKQLNRTSKLHEPLEGIGFEYGFNSATLKDIVKYWKDDYLPRWREREIFLWKFPHLTTQIQGLQIHFIQTKFDEIDRKGKKIYPVLILHGWPGSVREFYELIPKLAEENKENNYAFEVVAPSLPGYGWSQGASKPGLGVAQAAVILRNLMLRLGYNKFFVQGGDWGSIIGSAIATLFPENVIGYHSNMCSTMSPMANIKNAIINLMPSIFIEKEYEEFYPLFMEKFSLIMEESGYFHIQATKPDTIGTALIDNPIGLAAYILEKFSTWTDLKYRKLKDGGLTKDFSLDALLDNVMIYYLTNSITTSQRFYAESFSSKHFALNLDRVPTNVPTGCARFKNDLAHSHDWILKDKFTNLIHSTYHKNGGHFAAMQLPDVLYKDFIEFVEKVLSKDNKKEK